MGGKTVAAGVEPRGRLERPVAVGDFFNDGTHLYEVIDVVLEGKRPDDARTFVLVQDALASLEIPPDLLRVPLEQVADWKRVKLKVIADEGSE